jgi:hypothetical protein
MSGADNQNLIDVVAQTPDGDIVMGMVESRPWTSEPSRIGQLETKFETYRRFILEGGLAAHVPYPAGTRIRVQLVCVAAPPKEITAVIASARDRLGRHGILLGVDVRPAARAHRDRLRAVRRAMVLPPARWLRQATTYRSRQKSGRATEAAVSRLWDDEDR